MILSLLFAKLFWGDSATILLADFTRFTSMFSFVANIPRADLGTRVNPDACRILAGTGKFNLNTDFFLCGFQKHLDSKILCVIYSLQALSETT